jgi:D-alanyl-lipoteichoic acid biosynthesis protein DltD
VTDTFAGQSTPEHEYPHLIAGLVAAVCLLLAVGAILLYGQTQVVARSQSFNPSILDEEWRGKAAVLEVLSRDDLLPMYGSSELIVPMPNRVTDFFASYPTGFAVVPIGARGYPPLSMAVGLASLGSAVHGKRIVISLSGSWFLGDKPVFDTMNFRIHFSELQAGDLIFRSGLPIELRRRFATRILGYKPSTEIDPLLGAALSCLARRCVVERLLPALTPLWLVQSLPRRARDYAQLNSELRQSVPPLRRPSSVSWSALATQNDSIWRAQSNSNPFGIQDSIWMGAREKLLASKNTMSDSAFVKDMERAPMWEDLDLLLATLEALGARPLVLSTPLKGAWWDHVGVSASARARVYARLDSVAARFHVPARNFGEFDADPNFLSEPRSHLSAKGWVVYDQTINAFYHDSLR